MAKIRKGQHINQYKSASFYKDEADKFINFNNASFYKSKSDKFNSLEEKSKRLLSVIYKQIEESVSKGGYYVSIDVSWESTYDTQLLDNVVRILKEKGFTTSILSNNYVGDYTGPFSRFSGVEDKVILNINWEK